MRWPTVTISIVLASCGGSSAETGETPDAQFDATSAEDSVALDDGTAIDDSGSSEIAVPDAPADPSCYPFDQPSKATLRAARQKVWAFYYPPFPISIENGDPSKDFWTSWLTPEAKSGEYASIGGLMRDRPLPRAPIADKNWRQRDFETEVRRAIAAGIDGFIYEHPDHHATDESQNQLPTMLAAAAAVDPEFRIALSPDFPVGAGDTTDGLVATISAVATHPSLLRLPDGSIVLSSFAPQRQPVSFWVTLRDRLSAKGIKVAFWPFMPPVPPTKTVYSEWNDLLYGYGTFGERTVSAADRWRLWSIEAHNRTKKWMSPVAFQEVRNKIPDGRWYAESSNSGALRAEFEAAIAGDSDAVALLTWTDYTESWMSPSKERGFVISDLVAYYTAWFKVGSRPPIVRDALYYFHRNQHTDAPWDTKLQSAGPMAIDHSGPATNQVELLAFLASPGQLVITQGTQVDTKDVEAGMVSFSVPIVTGTTPAFELRRGGKVVQHIESNTAIRSKVVYQDMMVHAGGGLWCTRP